MTKTAETEACGVYRLNLRPVIDGTVWMEDQGIFWILDVR